MPHLNILPGRGVPLNSSHTAPTTPFLLPSGRAFPSGNRAAGSSISRLPPEILVEIIHIVKEEESSDWVFATDWIKTTQVSSWWRELAQGASSLWTDVVVPHKCDPEALGALLGLSKDRLLDVDLDELCTCSLYLMMNKAENERGQCTHLPNGLRLLAAHTHRLRTLSLYNWDLSHVREIQYLLSLPLHNLTQLFIGKGRTVLLPHDLRADIPRIPEHTLTFPQSLSGLRELTLDIPAWNGGLRALKHLTYQTHTLIEDRFSNFLTFLEGCPHLETLCFTDRSAINHLPYLPVPPAPFPLPGTLRTLTFNAREGDVRHLTQHFIVPHTTALHLIAQPNWAPGAMREPSSLLVHTDHIQALPAFALTHTLALTIGSADNCEHIVVVGSSASAPQWSLAIPEFESARTRALAGLSRLPSYVPQIVHGLHHLIFAAHVVQLEVHIRPSLLLIGPGEAIIWGSVLKSFPSLARLTVGGMRAVQELMLCLQRPDADLRALRELTICIAVLPTDRLLEEEKEHLVLAFGIATQRLVLEMLRMRVPARCGGLGGVNDGTTEEFVRLITGKMNGNGNASVTVLHEDCGACHCT